MTLLIWDLILVPIGWAWVWKQYTRLSITRWKLYNEAWICWHSFGRAMPSYCFFISLIHPFGLFSLMEFLIAEGGEAAIPMLAVCSCNSVVDIIFHQHSKARGTFQIKPPISHANNDYWKRKCHWFYTVSLADWLFNRHAHTHTHKKKKKTLIHHHIFVANLRGNSMLSFRVWDQSWAIVPKQSHIWLILHSGFLEMDTTNKFWYLFC